MEFVVVSDTYAERVCFFFCAGCYATWKKAIKWTLRLYLFLPQTECMSFQLQLKVYNIISTEQIKYSVWYSTCLQR